MLAVEFSLSNEIISSRPKSDLIFVRCLLTLEWSIPANFIVDMCCPPISSDYEDYAEICSPIWLLDQARAKCDLKVVPLVDVEKLS